MHRIKVLPASAPDKFMLLENSHDLFRDQVLIALAPLPVVTLFYIYIDRDAVAVRA